MNTYRGAIGLALAALLLAALTASIRGEPSRLLAAEPAATTVSLAIDYGDGVEKRFTALPWKKGATVLDALTAAQAHPRGIRFTHRGAGETAFVSKIDDLANEGGGGRNWRFHVNGKGGDRSCGIFELQAGDSVVWQFGL